MALTEIPKELSSTPGIVDNSTSTAITIDSSNNINIPDNGKAIFGAGSDLQIYHDASTSSSYIDEGGAGDLFVRATNIWFQNAGPTATFAKFTSGGAIELRHNDGIKFATTATGIDVTGNAELSANSSLILNATLTSDTNRINWDYDGTTYAHIGRENSTGDMQFTVQSSERMRIDSSGRVGIGMTANSGCLLNVNDHIRAENSAFLAGRETAALPAFAFHDDTDTGMFNVASNILAFSTAGTERMRIDASGNVGIGTALPQKIHGGASLDGETSTGFEFIAGNSTVATVGGEFLGGYAFRNNDSSGTPDHYSGIRAVAADSFGSANLEFYGGRDDYEAGTSPHMTIRGATNAALNGNVGIGTSTPDTLMHLSGDATAIIRLENTNGSASDGDVIGALQFYKADNSGAGAGVVGQVKMLTQGIGSGGHLTFSTGDSGGNDVERIRITSNGNVGIGTSSPSASLELNSATANAARLKIGRSTSHDNYLEMTTDGGDSVIQATGAASTYGALAFKSNNGTTTSERMRIDSSGNVGIGTTPIAPLHVKGTTDGNLLVRAGSLAVGTLTGTALSSINDAASATVPLTFEGSEFNFVQSNAVKMKVDSSGKITYGGISYGVAVDPDGSGGFGAGYNFETNAGSPRHLVTGPVSGQYLSSGGSPFVAWYTGVSAGAGTAAPERMRILSDGSVVQGNTVSLVASNYNNQAGAAWHKPDGHYEIATTSNVAPLEIGKNNATDGSLVVFRKQSTVVGTIGSRGGVVSHIILDPRSGGAGLTAAGASLFPTNNAGAVSDGAIDLGYSVGGTNYRFKDLYLSGGVVFGTTGGDVSSKTLDDYEEGTWTPTFLNVTSTATSAVGTYTKIGRVVFFNVNIVLSSLDNTDASGFSISLPFTSSGGEALMVMDTASTTLVSNANKSLILGAYTSGSAMVLTKSSGAFLYNEGQASGVFVVSGQFRTA